MVTHFASKKGVIQDSFFSMDRRNRILNDPNPPEQWWQEVYLLSELVYQLHQEAKIPGPGQCYALCPHPALGGPNPANGDAVDPKYVMVMDVTVWESLCAQSLGVGR